MCVDIAEVSYRLVLFYSENSVILPLAVWSQHARTASVDRAVN